MTLDLSAVTDSLIGLVKSRWTTAPIWAELGGSTGGPTFTPNFTGLAPDSARQQPGTQLSMYLYHVEPDNTKEALFWQDQMLATAAGEPTRFLPLALDLFYLLFAYSQTSYTEEQEAMSVALRIFHANPIVRSEPGASPPWELTLTMEHRSYDELSRLWQATTAPLRMSLVYRAAVVFIDPDPVPSPAPAPRHVSVAAEPAQLPLGGPGGLPAVLGTFRGGSYTGPTGLAVSFSQSVWLLGSNLGVAGVSDQVYLLPPAGGEEADVTAWAVAADSSAAKFVLALPPKAGTPPAASPAPGSYQLRAGGGSPGIQQTGSAPVSIAAYVDPAAGPVLTGPGPFTVPGVGFIPGATEVLIGTAALTSTSSVPAAGEFSVDPSGTSLSFTPAPGPAGTTAPLRVRVNGIESDPALWVTL
jgi:Pvc16 N-terminal domain